LSEQARNLPYRCVGETRGGVTIVKLRGLFSNQVARRSGLASIRQVVADHDAIDGHLYIFDCSDVDWIGDLFAALMIELETNFRRGGSRLVVVAPQNTPAGRTLRMFGHDRLYGIFDSESEALKALTGD
jgi:anti-anti-sigma regulatory factor